MAVFSTTSKWALRRLLGSNVGSDIDAGFAALADDIDPKLTPYDAGTLAARPVSTPGSPGKSGRLWLDENAILWLDYGTGWVPVNARWQTFQQFGMRFTQAGYGADQIVMLPPVAHALVTKGGAAYPVTPLETVRIDPADFPAGARMRIKVGQWNIGAATSGQATAALRLYPVTGTAAAPSRGAGVGSSRQLATLASGAQSQVVSAAFDVPAAGFYDLAATFFAMAWGTCDQVIKAELQWTPNPVAA